MINVIDIYNYCDNLWKELEKKDNGYLPSKHDPIVLKKASEKYNLSENKIKIIFGEVDKIIMDNKVKKMTQEQINEELLQILKNNKELEFNK